MVGPKVFVFKGYELSSTGINCIETRHAGTLARGIGIIEIKVVNEIVGSQDAHAFQVCIDAEAAFIVPKNLIFLHLW